MDKIILDAIKAGESILEEKRKETELKEKERQEQHKQYVEKVRKKVEEWSKTTLPELIKTETANNKRELYLGSSDSDKADTETELKVDITRRKLGLAIRTQHYDASPGEEGAYAHGSGWSYYITW